MSDQKEKLRISIIWEIRKGSTLRYKIILVVFIVLYLIENSQIVKSIIRLVCQYIYSTLLTDQL